MIKFHSRITTHDLMNARVCSVSGDFILAMEPIPRTIDLERKVHDARNCVWYGWEEFIKLYPQHELYYGVGSVEASPEAENVITCVLRCIGGDHIEKQMVAGKVKCKLYKQGGYRFFVAGNEVSLEEAIQTMMIAHVGEHLRLEPTDLNL